VSKPKARSEPKANEVQMSKPKARSEPKANEAQ
jgi:hypothetical protein